MSMDWFRSWHGAPTDPKWLLIARNAMKRSETHVTPGVVSAVVWALFDHASQAEQRGNVEGFDVETYSVFSGFSEAVIAAIIEEMKDKSLIISGVLSAWEKRQPKREDHSTERVRAHRNAMKRSETHGNAREDKIREDKIREEKKEVRAPALVFESDWPRDYQEEFWREYPKRVDKNAAFKKLDQIRRAGEVPWSTLIGGVQRYADKVRGKDPTYTKGPAAWLNAGKWDDEDTSSSFNMDDICPPEIYRNVL